MPAFYDCLIYIFLPIGVSWGILGVWWCVSLNWLVLIMVILFGVVVWFWWILVIYLIIVYSDWCGLDCCGVFT
jgi:hypothetical protein